MPPAARKPRVIPGFGVSLGFTVSYLSVIVLIPLAALLLKSSGMGVTELARILKQDRIQTAFYNTLTTALAAALLNIPLGLLIAWVLARYRFPGRRVLDAIVDLPFALPTAVAGIALAFLYSGRGWVGRALTAAHFAFPWPIWNTEGRSWPLSIKWYDAVGLSPLGIIVALLFVGMPFMIRTLQPVLEDMDADVEEAARSLGASRAQTFFRVILPQLTPAIVTGFALAFARGIGEYGSVLFIAGNQADTAIVPKLIIERINEPDIPGATAVASLLLVASFVMLLVINLLQRRLGRWGGR